MLPTLPKTLLVVFKTAGALLTILFTTVAPREILFSVLRAILESPIIHKQKKLIYDNFVPAFIQLLAVRVNKQILKGFIKN